MSLLEQERKKFGRSTKANARLRSAEDYLVFQRNEEVFAADLVSKWLSPSFKGDLAFGHDMQFEVEDLGHRVQPPPGAIKTHSADRDPVTAAVFAASLRLLAESTRFASSVDALVRNPSYLRIIGLGEKALPYLLAELPAGAAMWFPALAAISGEDVAAGEKTVRGAVEKWLKWGSARGLV